MRTCKSVSATTKTGPYTITVATTHLRIVTCNIVARNLIALRASKSIVAFASICMETKSFATTCRGIRLAETNGDGTRWACKPTALARI